MANKIQDEVIPYFVNTFPYYEPAAAQKVLISQIKDADEAYVFWSRQVGKSNICSYEWWNRLINYSMLGQTYLGLYTSESRIYDVLLSDILVEAFGPQEKDLNNIYIEPRLATDTDKGLASDWYAMMIEEWNKNPALYKKWIENKWIIIDETTNILYVKLFKKKLDVGSTKKQGQYYTGTLFTGAKLLFVSVSGRLNDILRGTKLHGVYGEEMGEWTVDPWGVVGPALFRQNGWILAAGTPNGQDPMNFVYTKFIQPVTESPDVESKKVAGQTIYTIKAEETTPPAEFDENNEYIEPEVKYRKKVLSIGKFEEIFPYVYEGTKVFGAVQATRKYTYKVQVRKNDDGTFQRDIDNSVKLKMRDGSIKEFSYYKYDIVATGKMGTGTLDDDQYNREYQMDFEGTGSKVFKDFSYEANVIPSELFIPEEYPTKIMGYDHGTKKEAHVTKDKKGLSASCIVKIAVVKVFNTYQYIIYDEKYLESATTVINEEFYQSILNDIPIVAESAMWREESTGRRTVIEDIYYADKSLKSLAKARTNIGIFKCRKRELIPKSDDFNRWFSQSVVDTKNKNSNILFRNPIDLSKPGRKIMITSNCKNLINIFMQLRTVKNERTGKIEFKKMRDDLYDAAVYPIDIMESYEFEKKKIEKFWNYTDIDYKPKSILERWGIIPN